MKKMKRLKVLQIGLIGYFEFTSYLRRKADRILNMPEDGKNTMLYTTTIPPEKLVKNQVAT